MSVARFSTIIRRANLLQQPNNAVKQDTRSATSTKYGGILPEPRKTPMGMLKIILTVISGILIGAKISKNIARFLKEYNLFVPSDDDDGDDDDDDDY